MYLHTNKQKKYFDEAIRLHRDYGYGECRISRILPIGHATVSRWIAIFASENEKQSIQMPKTNPKSHPRAVATASNDVQESHESEIARLQAQIKYERMRADAYDEMINVAESKFKISIRKSWRQTVVNLHAKNAREYPIFVLCKLFGVTKQAYYKYDEQTVLHKVAQEEFVLQYIREVRQKDHGIGGMKLWYMYRKTFGSNYPVGRDRFEDIVDGYGLKVRAKVRKPRTTDSTHGLPVYPNIIKEFIPVAPNTLWVSDITYITIWLNDYSYLFCYLSLILDAYTEEIIGWSVGPGLETIYPVSSLRQALKRIEGQGKINLVHHSDRGCQYASNEYISLLKRYEIRISMTESGDPKENAQAERINSTIKNELLKGDVFRSIEEVKAAVTVAVDFYNNERPHLSINMMTPAEAADHSGEIAKRWTSYRLIAIKSRQECLDLDIAKKALSLPPCQGLPFELHPKGNP